MYYKAGHYVFVVRLFVALNRILNVWIRCLFDVNFSKKWHYDTSYVISLYRDKNESIKTGTLI